MSVVALLADPQLEVYLVAAGVTFGIVGLEIISTIAGLPASSGVEHVLTGLTGGHAGLNIGHVNSAGHALAGSHLNGHTGDVGSQGSLSRALGWLNTGRVPALILLMLFLGLFAIGGIAAAALLHMAGLPETMFVSLPVALATSISTTHGLSRVFARYMPHDETEAISLDDMTGLVGIVCQGPVAPGHFAKARFKDRFGTTHWLHVKALEPEEIIEVDAAVLIVKVTADKTMLVTRADPSIIPSPKT